MFITTHYLEEAEYCDRLGLIYRGELIAIGTPEALKTELKQEDVLEILCERLQDAMEEVVKVFRDPKMKGVIFLMPIVQVLVFGYAVTTGVKHVTTAVYDLDNSITSRELVDRFVKSGYFDVVEYVNNEDRARKLVDRGEVRAVLHMNKGFGDDLRAGRMAHLQVIVDGTDSNTAGIMLDYSAKIAGKFSQKVLITRFTRLKGPAQEPGRVEVQTRAWFNENLESRNFYVPGVIAIIVLLITLMLTSMLVLISDIS